MFGIYNFDYFLGRKDAVNVRANIKDGTFLPHFEHLSPGRGCEELVQALPEATLEALTLSKNKKRG